MRLGEAGHTGGDRAMINAIAMNGGRERDFSHPLVRGVCSFTPLR
jgi:hypothetical protein